jgi:hypothetical protein
MHEELEKTFCGKKDSAILANMMKNMIKSITDNLKFKLIDLKIRIFSNNKNNIEEIRKNKFNRNENLENLDINKFAEFSINEINYLNTDKNFNYLVFDEKNKKAETFFKKISLEKINLDYYDTISNKNFNIKLNNSKVEIIKKENEKEKEDINNNNNNDDNTNEEIINFTYDQQFYKNFNKFSFIKNLDFYLKFNYIIPKLNSHEIKTIYNISTEISNASFEIPNKKDDNLFSFIKEIQEGINILKTSQIINKEKYYCFYEKKFYQKYKLENISYENFNDYFVNKKEKLKFYFCLIHKIVKQKKDNFGCLKIINKEKEELFKKEFFDLIQNRIFKKTKNEESKDIDILNKLFNEKLKFINNQKLLLWIGNLLESNLDKIKKVKE